MIDYIAAFFKDTKFMDIVDIGIISAFIYMVLVWLKKARARFIFIGMIAIGLIYIAARIFGLYLTTMALQAFFAVALIMVVVIFQDDLRHFFESVAIVGITRKHRIVTSSHENIDILMSAMANLSRKKIGALIVLKGKDPLDRHLEAGVRIDGLMSQVLLESIFDPHAPSHDGAVTVEGGRVAMLGCHLPLSININEIGRLGTRHAAALGIAEYTDALALVVSEEHGTIAAADSGRIKHIKDISQLNGILKNFYNTRFPEKKGLGVASFLVRHFPEKVIAIILACSLWAAFGHRIEMVRRDMVVPIEYRNLASDRIIKEPKVKEVTVTLSGTEHEFTLLKPKEIKVSIDTSKIEDGNNTFVLTKELVRNNAGLSVINIDPDDILLNSYRIVPVEIQVELITRGVPPPNVTVGDMKIEPKAVAALFPSVIPKGQAFIRTEPIDLSSITGKTTVIPKLSIAPDIRFTDDKYPEVKVTIDAKKEEGVTGK